MMKRILAVTAILALVSSSVADKGKPAYKLFNKKGKTAGYEAMMKDLSSADIVFFGELHDNPICHWLESEVMKDLYKNKGGNLLIGAEMFEADNQKALDSFLAGLYTEKEFPKAARLWPNYKTDYAPLVNFSKENRIPFIATNIPRRYASLVFKKGFEALDTLSVTEKSWMAPLPVLYDSTLPCYRDILKATGGHGGKTLPMAQAVKDATMAHFILKHWSPGKLFLHYNGTYHSDNFESIVWYLKQANPQLKIKTISSAMQESIDKMSEENKGRADYILVIPESMTRTY